MAYNAWCARAIDMAHVSIRCDIHEEKKSSSGSEQALHIELIAPPMPPGASKRSRMVAEVRDPTRTYRKSSITCFFCSTRFFALAILRVRFTHGFCATF